MRARTVLIVGVCGFIFFGLLCSGILLIVSGTGVLKNVNLTGSLNTLRIESLDAVPDSRQIEFPEFSYLGSPAFSFDGEWIAFDAYNGGYQGAPPECWVVRTDGTQRRRLATGQTPRWSPDGIQLLFMRAREQDRALGLGIFVINADGTGERRICNGWWPDWSPEGTRLTYADGGQSQGGGARVGARVYVANLDGSGAEEIGAGDCPSWSPDGTKIACCFVDPGKPAPFVRVIDLETKGQTLAGSGWWRANWSADGSHLYANSLGEGNRAGLFKLGLDERQKPEAVFTSFTGVQSPCESHDGKRVVFAGRPSKR